jgi:hypothetical protein
MKTLCSLIALAAIAPAQEPRAFLNIDHLAQVLPQPLKLKSGRHWQAQAAALANDALAQKALAHSVKFEIAIRKFEVLAQSSYGPMLRGSTAERDLTIQGVAVRLRLYAYFDKQLLPKLGAVTAQRAERFTGRIARADFTENGRVLNIDVTGCRPDDGTPLPPPVGDLQVLAASYGAGAKQANVAAQVRALWITKARSFTVNPQALGADPAPGLNKRLHVVYALRGKRYEAGFDETSTVAVPK